MDGNVVLGTVAVGAGGTATFTTSFAAAGGHVITAVYSGDVNFVASSQTLTEQVNAPTTHKATTTALSASANPVRVGRAVTFTATVRDPSGTGTPTGTVTFFVGNTVVARVTLDANGQARFTRVFSRRGPVHHPGGLQRRRQLRRQLPVPHRAGQQVVSGGEAEGRMALGEESAPESSETDPRGPAPRRTGRRHGRPACPAAGDEDRQRALRRTSSSGGDQLPIVPRLDAVLRC